MTDRKTVFVVGAGASFEMGLPVGEKLKAQISHMLAVPPYEPYQAPRVKNNDIYDAIRIEASTWEQPEPALVNMIRAADDIANALPLTLSIDNYIHSHNGDKAVEICGKLAIVQAILAAEAGSSLYKTSSQTRLDFSECSTSWLMPFMQYLSEDCSLPKLRERLTTVVFIVFNYDRCIEHFLIHAIMTVYKVQQSVAAEIVGDIEIYHPYGTVGRLPWATNFLHDMEIVEFGETPGPHKLHKLTSGIKTFTEGTDNDSSEIIAIRLHMKAASRIVFLGFAYHRLNMRLLFGDEPKRITGGRHLFGTAYGMSNGDVQNVSNGLSRIFELVPIELRNDLTCFNLFREYSRTLNFV